MLRKLLLRWIKRLEAQEDDTDVDEILKVVKNLTENESKGTNRRIAEDGPGKGCHNV